MVLPPKPGHHIKVPIRKPLAKAIKRELPTEHPAAPDSVDVTRDDKERSATSSKDNLPSIVGQASKPIKTHIGDLEVVRGKGDHICIVTSRAGNPHLLRVGSKAGNLFLRRIAKKREITLRDRDIKEIVETLEAYAEMELQPVDLYLRTAPVQKGFAIDLGDDQNSRVIIKPGEVEVVTNGCDVLFRRSSITQPFAKPANKGNLKLLKKYLNNIRPEMQQLLIGWISYTLTCPKIPSRNFVALGLVGPEGSGKSFTCKLISDLTDPNSLALQKMPKNSEDLVVAADNALVLIFDNSRQLTPEASDTLCQCTTGASTGKRQLFTNGELYVSFMHAAVVINSINYVITEPDLIQRSLILPVKGFDEADRISESELQAAWQKDLPEILMGIFELISNILIHLPNAKVLYPTRSIDYCRWLTAMEMADGVPEGVYQQSYFDSFKEAQLEGMFENAFAAAIYQFANSLIHGWKGRPSDLLQELNNMAGFSAQRSSDWPKSPEALSRRLKPLCGAFKSQGIFIDFSRSKHRQIDITTTHIQEQY